MTQDMLNDEKLKKVLDKVQKLKAHAESAEALGSEAEAQAFAALYQRLMLQHNLEMSDLEFASLDVEDPIERHEVDWERYAHKKTTSQPWEVRLANLVMKAHNCRHIRFRGSNRFVIIGRKADAQVAEWMYVTLHRACQRIANDETARYRWQSYKKYGSTAAARGFKKSFVQGFIVRLNERLESTFQETVTTETALVRVNQMTKKLDEFMDTQGVVHTKSMMRPANHGEGYQRGRAAADRVDLTGKAIGGQARTQLT